MSSTEIPDREALKNCTYNGSSAVANLTRSLYLGDRCHIWPHCTFRKQICKRDHRCNQCEEDLFQRNQPPAEVFRERPYCSLNNSWDTSSNSSKNLFQVLFYCAKGPSVCALFQEQCRNDRECEDCMSALGPNFENTLDGLASAECGNIGFGRQNMTENLGTTDGNAQQVNVSNLAPTTSCLSRYVHLHSGPCWYACCAQS